MPVQPFGKAEANYDALRVQSHQSIDPGPGDGTTTGGAGGLENKIYLWPADGSSISIFDPDETGLDAALAGAASGDTVWLPSIPIALTAAVTVPAEVSVKGLSHKSILSFSGFSDPCMVLSAGSIIQDFTLNHEDGQWFDASAEDSKALRIHGTAQRAIVGTATPAEPWFATAADVFWLDRNVNAWHKITPGLGTISNFFISADGVTAYLHITSGAWYKGTTLKTSPTWTSILTDASDYSRNGVCDGTNFYAIHVVDYSTRTWKHGTYNGTSWSYGSDYVINWFSPDCMGKDFAIYLDVVKNTSGSNIESAIIDYTDGGTGHGTGWVNSGGTRFAWGRDLSNHVVLRIPNSSSIIDLGAGSMGDVRNCRVRGSISGLHIYAIDHNGVLHYSSNGSSFSSVATWAAGYAYDTLSAGGGDIVWIPIDIADNAVPARLYANGAWTSTDLTYNLWSLTSGDKVVQGMGVVYA